MAKSSFRSLAIGFLESSAPAAAAATLIFVGLTGLSLAKVPAPYGPVVSWSLVSLVVVGALVLLWVVLGTCWRQSGSPPPR